MSECLVSSHITPQQELSSSHIHLFTAPCLYNKHLTPEVFIHFEFFPGKAPLHSQPASPHLLLQNPAQADHPGFTLSSF